MLILVSCLTSIFQEISRSFSEDIEAGKTLQSAPVAKWPCRSKFIFSMDFLDICSQLLGYLRGTKIKLFSVDDGSRNITIVPLLCHIKNGTRTKYSYCVGKWLAQKAASRESDTMLYIQTVVTGTST